MRDRFRRAAVADQQTTPLELRRRQRRALRPLPSPDDLVEQRDGHVLLLAARARRRLPGEQQHLETAALERQLVRRSTQRADRRGGIAAREREQGRAKLRAR